MKKTGWFSPVSSVILFRIKYCRLLEENTKTDNLYLTDIGYYPRAQHHFRERHNGIGQTILIYNVDGTGIIKVGDTSYQLDQNHFFIIPEGMPHTYHSDKKNPWSIYWIHFSGKKSPATGANRCCSRLKLKRTSKTSRINERLELFSEMFQNLERGYSLETLEYNQFMPAAPVGHLHAP